MKKSIDSSQQEHINQILMEKTKLAEIAIDENELSIAEMTDDDLKNILKLRRMN